MHERQLRVNCRRSCELGKALNGRQDSKLRPLPSELLIVGDHEVSPVVNDSVGNCTGNRSLARNQKPVRSTSWLHRSIPSRPITKTFSTRPWPDSYRVETKVLVQAVKRNLARF